MHLPFGVPFIDVKIVDGFQYVGGFVVCVHVLVSVFCSRKASMISGGWVARTL